MNKIKTAEIIAVGTELLLGNITNSNARFLANEFAGLGINVYYQTVVGDNRERILSALETAFGRADTVITTGGLGPTNDDITKETCAEFFGRRLILHEESLERMKERFKKHNREMTPNNIKQAYMPEGCIVINNNNGTAPGCIIEDKGRTVINLPGPPHELLGMFNESIAPYLKKRTDGNVLVSEFVFLSGIGESLLETKMADLTAGENPTVGIYATPGSIKLRITAKAANKETAEKMIEPVLKDINKRFDKFIMKKEDLLVHPEFMAAELLIEKGYTICCAESCTGGLITELLTEIPGISKALLETVVCYSNESKVKRLSVNKETLEKYGAVSSQTAEEMARGAALSHNADIGLSVTGIAGPDGGTNDKPVGLVYIGLYKSGEAAAKEFRFKGGRREIRQQAADEAFRILIKAIK